MNAPTSLSSALAEIYAQTLTTRQLTVADRHEMRTALLDSILPADELRVIDRFLYAVRRGQLQISA